MEWILKICFISQSFNKLQATRKQMENIDKKTVET